DARVLIFHLPCQIALVVLGHLQAFQGRFTPFDGPAVQNSDVASHHDPFRGGFAGIIQLVMADFADQFDVVAVQVLHGNAVGHVGHDLDQVHVAVGSVHAKNAVWGQVL